MNVCRYPSCTSGLVIWGDFDGRFALSDRLTTYPSSRLVRYYNAGARILRGKNRFYVCAYGDRRQAVTISAPYSRFVVITRALSVLLHNHMTVGEFRSLRRASVSVKDSVNINLAQYLHLQPYCCMYEKRSPPQRRAPR